MKLLRCLLRAKDDEGAALPLIAGILATLLGLSAFAVDLGWIYLNTSRLQRAADAAALAGVVHLPSFPGLVTQDATSAATANGFEPNTGPNGPLSWEAKGDMDNKLEVTLTTNVQPFFLRVLGFNNFAITRRSTAEYIKPVPIGSPFSSFGDGTDANQNFWAAISGQYTAKANGDAFNSRCDWSRNLGSCVDSDLSNAGLWGDNPGPYPGHNPNIYPGDIDADTDPSNPTYQRGGGQEGYYFGIEKIGTGTMNVRLLDPHFQRRTPNSSSACDQGKASGDCDRLVWGPPTGSGTNGPDTVFTLYNPDSTPLDPYDNNSVRCGPTTYPRLDPTSSSSISEANFCDVNGPPGLYVLRVHTTGGHGSNQFGIRTYGAEAKVYGINDISIYANADNATLYLTEILPVHAGKKLILEFFDPGEGAGNASMTILPAPRPSGGGANTGIACNWIAEDTDGNQQTSGTSCKLDTTLGGVAQFNNYWVRVTIDIPSTYDCDPDAPNPANGCWWRMDMDLNTPHDRTTWTAKVVGNPVRLVANE